MFFVRLWALSNSKQFAESISNVSLYQDDAKAVLSRLNLVPEKKIKNKNDKLSNKKNFSKLEIITSNNKINDQMTDSCFSKSSYGSSIASTSSANPIIVKKRLLFVFKIIIKITILELIKEMIQNF